MLWCFFSAIAFVHNKREKKRAQWVRESDDKCTVHEFKMRAPIDFRVAKKNRKERKKTRQRFVQLFMCFYRARGIRNFTKKKGLATHAYVLPSTSTSCIHSGTKATVYYTVSHNRHHIYKT